MGLCSSKNIEAAKAKANEMKDNMDKKNQEKWMKEVVDAEKETFYGFEKWAELYEPKKDKEEEDKEKEPGAVQKKVMKKLCVNINTNIIKGLMDAVSQILGPIEPIIAEGDANFAQAINCGAAVTLTYRFQYKDPKVFAFGRHYAVEKLALALAKTINAAAAGKGVEEGAEISPEMVEEIVQEMTKKLTDQVEFRKEQAEEAMKNSPLFETDVAGDVPMDEGVKMLVGFLQEYATGKISVIVEVLNEVIGNVIKLVSTHRAAITKFAAAQELAAAAEKKDGEEEAAIEGQDDFDKAVDEITASIDEKFELLNQAGLDFIAGVIETATGIPVDVSSAVDADEEEEKKEE